MKIFFAIMILFFLNCSLYTPAKIGIIKYYGFDFSGGGYNKTEEKNDLTLIYNDALYFHTLYSDSNFISDLGHNPFNSININNLYWDTLAYVIPGHLYIVKCKDGYAKFKIVSVSGSHIYNYEVHIFYEYSESLDL